MKFELDIYKGKAHINHIESEDELKVLREFTKCMTSKIRGICKHRVYDNPYENALKIIESFNGDVAQEYRYVYVFTGIKNM